MLTILGWNEVTDSIIDCLRKINENVLRNEVLSHIWLWVATRPSYRSKNDYRPISKSFDHFHQRFIFIKQSFKNVFWTTYKINKLNSIVFNNIVDNCNVIDGANLNVILRNSFSTKLQADLNHGSYASGRKLFVHLFVRFNSLIVLTKLIN